MNTLDTLQALFIAYLDEADELSHKYRPTDGLFGMGTGLKDDPFHDRFDTAVTAWMNNNPPTSLSTEEVYAIVDFLLGCEKLNRKLDCTRWMLVAQQRHVIPMLSVLSKEQKKTLRQTFEKMYPRMNRFPMQEDILRALKR